MAHSLSQVTAVSSVLPAVALIFCVVYSIVHHSHISLATHCHVTNYLPSISAAAGEASPEKQVWSLLLTISCALRLILAMGYYMEFQSRMGNAFEVSLHMGLNCIELASLFGLSVISSSDNFPIHRNCFATFLISSTLYMMLHLRVCCLLRQKILISPMSFAIKMVTFGVYCLSIGLAMYFYMRHQRYCEKLIYTYFAATEYIVVYMNILFHFTAYFDLSHLTVGPVLNWWLQCDRDDRSQALRARTHHDSYRDRGRVDVA